MFTVKPISKAPYHIWYCLIPYKAVSHALIRKKYNVSIVRVKLPKEAEGIDLRTIEDPLALLNNYHTFVLSVVRHDMCYV